MTGDEPSCPSAEKEITIDLTDGAVTDPEDDDLDSLKIFYAYCGESREGDIRDFLDQMSKSPPRKVEVTEIDLCRNAEHGLSDDDFVSNIVQDIKDHKYDSAIITPPCHTHSRALFAN